MVALTKIPQGYAQLRDWLTVAAPVFDKYVLNKTCIPLTIKMCRVGSGCKVRAQVRPCVWLACLCLRRVCCFVFLFWVEGRLPRDFQKKKECIADNSYWASNPMTHSDYAKACVFSTAA